MRKEASKPNSQIFTVRRPTVRPSKLQGATIWYLYSLRKKQSSTMGPLLCASLAGDVELVKSLLEAKCQVDGQPLEPMEEVGIVGGLTPLHVVVMSLAEINQTFFDDLKTSRGVH